MRTRSWRRRRRGSALAGLSLERADEKLLGSIDGQFRATAAMAGDWLACRPGCSECCHGPFPISPLDAWRLGRGLAELENREPARTARIRERAARAVDRLRHGYPGDRTTGELRADVTTLDRFHQQHRDLACPALDPADGRCELYDWRPVACRTYGPPLRFRAERAGPCHLCFAGAAPDVVEACRMEPDLDLEGAVMARLGADREWETLIAFALVREERNYE